MAEVVGHREVLQTPSTREAVAHEIHAPDRACQLQRHALIDRPLALLASEHSQVGLPLEAVHPLVIDTGKLRAQQVVNALVVKTSADMRDLYDLLADPAWPGPPLVDGGSCRGKAPQAGTLGAWKNGVHTPCAQPPHAWPGGLALYPQNALKRMHIQVRLITS